MTAEVAAGRAGRRIVLSTRTAAATAYVSSMTLVSLDSHVVNIMLPTLTQEFDSSLGVVKWSVLSYVLSMAVALPVAPWLRGCFGERRVFIWATVGFVVASAACGAAQSLGALIGFRVAQGIGAGLIGPLSTAMLYRAYPQAERARITRMLLMPIALGPALAPPLGGFLVEHLSWRVAFFINVPIGLATVAIVWLGFRADRPTERVRLNVTAFLTSGLALTGIIYVLGEAPALGWTNPLILGLSLATVVSLFWFINIERHHPDPLLGITLLRERVFRFSNLGTMLQTIGWLGGLYYVTPLLLQEVGGHSPLMTGLVLTCIPVGVVLSTQTVARAYDRIGPRMLTLVGQGGLAVMLLALATYDGATPIWVFCVTTFLAGLFNGMAMVSLQASMFANVADKDLSRAATLLNVNRQASTAVGAGIATAVITAGTATTNASAPGPYQVAFLIAAVVSVGAGLAGLALPGPTPGRSTAEPVLDGLPEAISQAN
jgi:EmrB/QacA subfamily drug resistance transporter